MASHSSGLWGFPTSACNHPGCTSMHGTAPQAGIHGHSTPVPVAGEVSQPPPITLCPPLPTDTSALHSMIYTLQARLQANINVNAHLAASVTHLQADQAIPAFIPTCTCTPTPTTATTATEATAAPAPAPIPCQHPGHPYTITSGRGAASPEIFKEMIKTNWHGRLGRVHMVDVDALPPAALMELDKLVRQNLHDIFPRGKGRIGYPTDTIFAGLAALGLRLEDRARFLSNPALMDDKICNDSTTKRALQLSAYFYGNQTTTPYANIYGLLVETLVELARYRGLFDADGYVKRE